GASGAGATVLGGATAVCTLDAAWDADKGEAVVAIVTRQAGKDKVWLARGKPGGTFAAVEVTSKTSKGDCRQGIAGAKLTVRSGSAIVSWFEALLPSVPTAGMVYAADVSGAKVTSLTKMPTNEAATSDSGSGAAPANALATRGLAGVVDNGTTVSAIIEATVAGKRQIILHTFIP
ncbi:MAG: hypothetical protein RIT45_1498, partial [Pseudomonadota bacterium]